jgi:hypothetical protein
MSDNITFKILTLPPESPCIYNSEFRLVNTTEKKILLYMMTDVETVKKFTAFHKIWNFITVFTTAILRYP